MPVTTSPTRSTYSSYIIERSASRIRCRITCFAVCAAMRPKFSGVTSSRLMSRSGTSDQSSSRSSSETRVCERSPVSTSSASSSSSLRSRASASRRSSRSSGSSIENTRKSPLSSSSTVACRAAPGVFLYAARSASSSAATSAPFSMPFSRSISRTASIISCVISVLPFVDQIAAHDLVIGISTVSPSTGETVTLALAGCDQLAAEAPAAVDLVGRAERDAPAHHAREVRGLAQRPLEPRRGDVDACSGRGSRAGCSSPARRARDPPRPGGRRTRRSARGESSSTASTSTPGIPVSTFCVTSRVSALSVSFGFVISKKRGAHAPQLNRPQLWSDKDSNSPASRRTIVTGPSLTSSTCIRAPKTPVSTGTPSPRSAAQNAS